MEPARVVEVIPFDASWRSRFEEESAELRRAMGPEVLEVHHIGSTAIPGMWAKPTIDILIVVRNIDAVDSRNRSMAAIGYTAMGEFGIPGRRFFAKGGNRRSHHVHVFQSGSPEIARHIAFRDYLIAHPREATRYAELKRLLAREFGSDIDSYCRGKEQCIREVEAKAAAWAKGRKE